MTWPQKSNHQISRMNLPRELSPFSKNRECKAKEEKHMYSKCRPSSMSGSLQCGDEAIKAEAEREKCVRCVTSRTKDILCFEAEMLLT